MATQQKSQIFQLVCVVRDVEQTLENWKRYVEFDESSIRLDSSEAMAARGETFCCLYHGKSVRFPFKSARFNLGGLDLVLVQPCNDSGDPYSDVLRQQGQGFHHVGIWLTDPERVTQVCTSWGYPPAAETVIDGKPYLLFDLREKMGLQFTLWDHMIGPCGPRDPQGRTL